MKICHIYQRGMDLALPGPDFYETHPVQGPNVRFGNFGGCLLFRIFFLDSWVLVCLGSLSVKMHIPFINIFHEASVRIKFNKNVEVTLH